MEKQKVAVMFGGCSSEYNISLQSAYSVITHLNAELYDIIPVGITQSGNWLRYYGAPEKIADNTWTDSGECIAAVISPDRGAHGLLEFHDDKVITTRIDVAFPVLHGKNGEDGTLQGLLTMAGIPFAGCGVLSSAICMDKDIAHKLAGLAGIKTPASIVWDQKTNKKELLSLTGELKYPLFVKPVNAGSSLGITRVMSKKELPDALRTALAHDRRVIIEEAVAGFEVGCAVLGNEILTIGEVDEIELTQGFFDYTEKYTLKTSTIHMPARIDRDTAQRLKQTAAVIYKALHCSGCARVDMFLTPDQEIIFNEVNTIPGFTSHSRYPSMLGGIGLTFEQIVDSLIKLALEA